MLLEPRNAQNLIVGVVIDNSFAWYVTEKDLWIMDYEKRKEDYRKKIEKYNLPYNIDSHKDRNERNGIPLLNEFSINDFKYKIEKYLTLTDELREFLEFYLLIESKEDAYYSFLPALYLDFDKKELYSLTECDSFEAYVANGWIGKYQDFLDKIDYKYKYWYDACNNPIINFSKGVGNA